MADDDASGPALAGVRVLDLGQVYNGSYCGLLLAHLGADVVKLEPPGGETMRWRAANGLSRPFLMLNSNKLGISLNLKDPQGRELFLRLVEQSDVLLENFAADTMTRLGLDYDTLQRLNPRLIYASGRGYGSAGPNRTVPAMDLTVQASTGILAATGFPDGPPVKAGAAVADFLGGVHLVAGILAALYQRERTGRGQLVEVAMQDALVPSLASNLAGLLDGGVDAPERTGNRHASRSMCPYNAYPVTDGWVTIFCTRDSHWSALCECMGRPDLGADPRYARQYDRIARMDEVDALVAGWTSTMDRDPCVARLTAHQVPAAAVRHVAEVAADPDLLGRGVLHAVDYPGVGQTLVFGSPLNLSDSPTAITRMAPRLGEHTAQVLADRLGLTPDELERLRSQGSIVYANPD